MRSHLPLRPTGLPKREARGSRAPTLLVLLALVSIAGCGSETGAGALNGVEIDLAVDPSGVEACRIERIARVDQDRTPLYMVRGEARYSAADHPVRRIPIQFQFRGIEGVVTDRAVTLTDLPVDCAAVSVEMVFEECIAVDRSAVDCPPIELRGQEAFAAVSSAFPE